jgi:hypothetical protein
VAYQRGDVAQERRVFGNPVNEEPSKKPCLSWIVYIDNGNGQEPFLMVFADCAVGEVIGGLM